MLIKNIALSALAAVGACSVAPVYFQKSQNVPPCADVFISKTDSFELKDFLSLNNKKLIVDFDFGRALVQGFDSEMAGNTRALIILSDGDLGGEVSAWLVFSELNISFDTITIFQQDSNDERLIFKSLFYDDNGNICSSQKEIDTQFE